MNEWVNKVNSLPFQQQISSQRHSSGSFMFAKLWLRFVSFLFQVMSTISVWGPNIGNSCFASHEISGDSYRFFFQFYFAFTHQTAVQQAHRKRLYDHFAFSDAFVQSQYEISRSLRPFMIYGLFSTACVCCWKGRNYKCSLILDSLLNPKWKKTILILLFFFFPPLFFVNVSLVTGFSLPHMTLHYCFGRQ